MEGYPPSRKNLEGLWKFLVALLSIAVTGCAGARTEDVARSTAPPARAAVAQTATVTSIAAETRTAESPTPSPVAFVTSWTLQGSLGPFLTAPRVIPDSWSPDSRFLSFWTWTVAEVEVDYLLPAGTIHFFDAVARRACDSPVEVGFPYFGNMPVWQDPGVAWMVTEDGRLAGLQPCSVKDPVYFDFAKPITGVGLPPQAALVIREEDGSLRAMEASGDSHEIVVMGGTSTYLFGTVDGRATDAGAEILRGPYSPDGLHLAISEFLPETSFTVVTKIVEVATAQERAAVSWEQQPPMAGGVYVSWLNNEELFIGDHVIGEPLILRVGGQVVRVASDLFRRDCSGTVCLLGSTPIAGSGAYHLLLEDPREEYYPRPWLMYHSEDGMVEALPLSGGYAFSPDGRTVSSVLPAEGDVGMGLWWRPSDGRETEPRFFTFSAADVSYAWSPDSSKVAFAFDGGFGVISTRPPAEAMLWATGDYDAGSFTWSPDSSHLAVLAHKQGVGIPGPGDGGLFTVDVP